MKKMFRRTRICSKLKREETNLYRQIEQLEAEIKRLRGFETTARDLNNDLIRIAGERDELAARIQELEDAHKRSGVKYAKIINELRSSVYANIPGLKKQWDEILNTPTNGKIGPEDVKPRSWQITDERVEALKVATGEMDLSENIFYLNSLKAMLEEVSSNV